MILPFSIKYFKCLAAALGDDANFSSTVTTSIGTKLSKDNNLSDLTDAPTARTNLNVDIAGTDNSTNVTLTSIPDNYLEIDGQEITAGIVPISLWRNWYKQFKRSYFTWNTHNWKLCFNDKIQELTNKC